jgi:predicted GNAT family N-acyltransferase
MDLSDYSLTIINQNTPIGEFDCGDKDLNEFLLLKAKHYTKELLATTYILEKENKVVAFFSIFNDNIEVEDENYESKSQLRKIIELLMPYGKRHLRYFPAIKIGRLAVCSDVQKCQLGRTIISFIIDLALTQSKSCACRFLSVDAYAQSLGFYEKRGFKYLTEKDKNEDTRQMYLDLTPYINAQQDEG